MARSRGKRVFGTLLFIVALLATAAFVLLLFFDSHNVRDVWGVGELPTAALVAVIGLGAVALLLFIMVLVRPWERGIMADFGEPLIQFVEAHDEARVLGVDQPGRRTPAHPLRGGLVPVDLRTVPLAARAWGPAEQQGRRTVHPFHYPRAAGRALYSNDYIDIGGGHVLRLRTLLAAPAGAFRTAVEERPARPRLPSTEQLERRRESDRFMQTLEEKVQEKSAQRTVFATPGGQEEAYYDYRGDVHDVIDVEGIGDVYAGKLREAGVETTARLCYEDAGQISRITGAPRKTVEMWQASAELMKVQGIGKQYAEALARAGVSGIAELKKRSAQVLADQVNEYLESLDQNVLGQPVTAPRVDAWKDAAAGMRRVRMEVPTR
jgi:predicted flap endonuclease-1-like 5' DNA nuclease